MGPVAAPRCGEFGGVEVWAPSAAPVAASTDAAEAREMTVTTWVESPGVGTAVPDLVGLEVGSGPRSSSSEDDDDEPTMVAAALAAARVARSTLLLGLAGMGVLAEQKRRLTLLRDT